MTSSVPDCPIALSGFFSFCSLEKWRQLELGKGESVATEQPPPEVLALLIADQVYQDPVSGKVTVLGMSSAIGATVFPFSHPGVTVYAALTDGRGETPIQVRLLDVDEVREPVWEHQTDVSFPDPITEVELVVVLDDIVFPEPGEYRLQLLGAGQLLRERRLMVIALEDSDSA